MEHFIQIEWRIQNRIHNIHEWLGYIIFAIVKFPFNCLSVLWIKILFQLIFGLYSVSLHKWLWHNEGETYFQIIEETIGFYSKCYKENLCFNCNHSGVRLYWDLVECYRMPIENWNSIQCDTYGSYHSYSDFIFIAIFLSISLLLAPHIECDTFVRPTKEKANMHNA